MFIEVKSPRDIAAVARLARTIWRDHYQPIIGERQVAYMLEKFQSADAIAAQIAAGDWYFLIRPQRHDRGYIGLQRRDDAIFLSKLYVEKSVRGGGIGRRAVDFVAQFTRDCGLPTVRLTVNRHNHLAIAVYEKTGFVRCGELITDIGGGYVMDDYVFELAVNS